MPVAQNRIREVVANHAPPCGQSRSSTAIEHPGSFSGDVGSIPIGRAIFDGPLSLGYRRSPKGRAGSNPAPAARWLGSQLVFCPSPLFDGSQDWVIAHNDVVAGSSPASGTKCRSSSVVEHVNSQFVSYPSVLSAGRRLWVLVDPAVAVQVRPEEQSEVV